MNTNHYGLHVNSEVPTTGVFQNNHLEWLDDDLSNGIDTAYEAHCEECPNEDHDSCWCDSSPDLIGFVRAEDGKYEPDPNAEYSAIVGEVYTQVVASKWRIRGALCSPCYPGQVDADTPGEFLAYSLPPDVIGKEGEPDVNRVFEAPKD